VPSAGDLEPFAVTALRGSFKRILVPVDFSTRSANALEFAVAFGSLYQAEVDVLHVWHSDLTTGVTVAKERAKNALREFVASLALHGDVELRRRTDHGDPYLTIQRVAQLAGHDLIVVAGPEGQRATEATIAKSLLSSAPCAVLFVPPNSKARRRSEQDRTLNVERVLVPLSLAGDDLEALDCAEALTSAQRGAIEVLSSGDVTSERRARLHARPAHERREDREEADETVLAMQKRAHASVFDLVVLCAKRAPIGGRPADSRCECVAMTQPRSTLCLPG
jgi:nucleotide-binding universal stress UspA family protein